MTSACQAPHEFDAALVSQIAQRLGVGLMPDLFMAEVSRIYKVEQTRVLPADMDARFRQSEPFAGFMKAIRTGAEFLRRAPVVLVVGCGSAYAGQPAQFAAKVVREIVPAVSGRLETYDLEPEELTSLTLRDSYDLVVTHSFLHFVPAFTRALRLVASAVAPGGALVIGREPDARFWAHPAAGRLLRRQQAAFRKRQQLRRFVSPRRYLRKISPVFGRREELPLHTLVNRELRRKFGCSSDVTPQELSAIVDPHMPGPDGTRIGQCGLDIEQIRRTVYPFALRFSTACDFRGIPPAAAQAAGLSGSVFSATFLRQG